MFCNERHSWRLCWTIRNGMQKFHMLCLGESSSVQSNYSLIYYRYESKRVEIENWLHRMESRAERMGTVAITADILDAQQKEQKVRTNQTIGLHSNSREKKAEIQTLISFSRSTRNCISSSTKLSYSIVWLRNWLLSIQPMTPAELSEWPNLSTTG